MEDCNPTPQGLRLDRELRKYNNMYHELYEYKKENQELREQVKQLLLMLNRCGG